MTLRTFTATLVSAQLTGLTATATSSTTINVSWNAYPGATAYQVRRNGTLIATPTGTTYTNSGHTASTLYTYAVRPVVGGVGVASAEASVNVTTVGVVFSDSFESGDLSTTQNGFYWGGRYVGPTGSFTGVSSGIQSPFSTGSNSLQFHYEPLQSMCEQRMFLGGSYPDVYIRYSLRIPSILSAWGGNNKFIALWTMPNIQQTYGGIDAVINWGYTSGSNDLRLNLSYFGGTQQAAAVNNFVLLPRDLGRWMEIVYRYRMATSSGANNGIWQMWRRWHGETSHTQLVNATGLPWWDAASAGWSAGYLMGWANSQYPQATDFYIDDFTVSTSSLVI